MATASGLMGVGFPAEQALRAGVTVISVTTSATATQLKGPGNLVVLVTVASANQDVLLPANAETGDVVELYNVDGTDSFDILPQSGGTINNGATDAGLALAATSTTAAAGVIARKVSATNWRTK